MYEISSISYAVDATRGNFKVSSCNSDSGSSQVVGVDFGFPPSASNYNK